jgi:hypothetical protein
MSSIWAVRPLSANASRAAYDDLLAVADGI